ncbi:MAG: outer membrane beta-barrel protein [Bacteroidaceae bacterium]|nr:outer membrane beta-barrel protein [Bacteroidaceae bacterium]
MKKVILFVCLLMVVPQMMGQRVVMGTVNYGGGGDWSDPELESYMRTYIKQLFQVEGKVFGVDDYEPTPYPLQGANIKVTCMGDTTAFDGMAADKDGSFWVYISRRERLKDTRLRVIVSYLGMGTLDTIFDIKSTKMDGIDTYAIQLDSVILRSNPLTTQEVEIVAELQRMYQRGDTIIFNADAYEMPTGSVLLDLVRRLPGLRYEDGSMTYLGRSIEEIRLNGDSFFKRDMSIALNNMPTEKLKSLKVYEVPDDTLNRMSDNHLVMDMETKDPMERTVFASVAAATTDRFDRYSISANASTWKQGGTELYASLSRSTIPSEYSYSLKSESTSGSLYIDKEFEKVDISGSVSYNGSYSENKDANYNKMFMPEFTQNSVSESESSSGSHSINGWTSARWHMGENGWMNVNLSYSGSGGSSYSNSIDSISNEGEGLVSFTRQTNRSENRSDSYTMNLGYNTRFGEDEAYSLSTSINYRASNGSSVSYNESESRFYKLNDSTRMVNHRILSPSNNNSVDGSLYLDRSVGLNGYIGMSYDFSYDGTTSIQNYEDIGADGTLSAVDSLHYDKNNSNITNSLSLSYYYTDSLYRFNVSAQGTPTLLTIDNTRLGDNEHIRYFGIRYNANVNFRVKVFRGSEFAIGYNGFNGLPGVSQLSTVTDYSDPMNIHEGNSALKNSFTHNADAEFQWRSYMRTRISYGTTFNEITTLTRLDRATGARRTSPANISGSWNMSEYLFLTYPFRDLSLSFTANHSFRHNVGYVQSYTDSDPEKSATDWNQLAFTLSGGYSNSSWIFRAETGYSKERSKSDYLDKTNGGQRIVASGDVSYTTKFGLGASTTCRFNKPFGYEMADANRAECLWNISLDYSFLKSRQAEVSVMWRDILKSYNGFSAQVSGTSWNESRSYGDTSMIVITFRYRFNDFR